MAGRALRSFALDMLQNVEASPSGVDRQEVLRVLRAQLKGMKVVIREAKKRNDLAGLAMAKEHVKLLGYAILEGLNGRLSPQEWDELAKGCRAYANQSVEAN